MSTLEQTISELTDSEEDEYSRMVLMLELYQPRPEVREFIEEAYNSVFWDWTLSNGCNAVTELHSPKGMRFPPCVGHDKYCDEAMEMPFKERMKHRSEGDRLFYLANLDFQTGRLTARRRFVGVRLYWLGVGWWVSIFQSRTKKMCPVSL